MKLEHGKPKGFALLEVLVAVAIFVLLMAAIVPSALGAIQAGHESTAAQNLRQFAKAESDYATLYPNIGFAATVSNLGGTTAQGCPGTPDTTSDTSGQWSCLLPDATVTAITNGQPVSGYLFTYTAPTQVGGVWAMTAVPSSAYSGRKSYCVDSSGAIRYVLGMTAPTVTNGSCTSGALLGLSF